MKRLNGYLENLQKPGRDPAQPLSLTFYIRETKEVAADAGPAVLGSGTVSTITSQSCFCLSSTSEPGLLVLRVSDGEFHPPD